MTNQFKKISQASIIGMIGGLFILLFLKGSIFPIQYGTHEGGLIAAIGVATILIFMAVVVFLVAKLTKSEN